MIDDIKNICELGESTCRTWLNDYYQQIDNDYFEIKRGEADRMIGRLQIYTLLLKKINKGDLN